MPISAFGRRSVVTSEDFENLVAFDVAGQHRGFHGFDRDAGEAQFGRRAAVVGNLEADVETTAARFISRRNRLQRAGVRGVELDILNIPIECQAEIGGLAEAVAVLERTGDLEPEFAGLDGARQPGHGDRLDVPGVDADHLMRLQRGNHLRGRQRAGGAEIGRPVDRDLRRCAGIVDHVADPNHGAGDGDAGAKHGSGDCVSPALGQCAQRCGHQQNGCEQNGANEHGQPPQRNNAEVVCSI